MRNATAADPFAVPPLTALRRRASGVAFMARAINAAPQDAAALLDAISQQCRSAAGDPRLEVVVPALWRVEAYTLGGARRPLEPPPLITGALPSTARPMAHVGWGIGAAQRAGFEIDSLRRALASSTEEDLRPFCWEGIGSNLFVHARADLRLPARIVGIIRGGAEPPDRRNHFARLRAALTPEEDRVLAHGFGRMVLVAGWNVPAALREATRMPAEWRTPAVQGIAFAFALVNRADLPRILDRSRDLAHEHAAAFRNGLVYAIVFCEWFGPGLLARWEARGAFEAELIARARREAALDVERRRPLPYALAEPEP